MKRSNPNAHDTIDPAWAWSAYQPNGAQPWNLAWAGHLLRRAGFGAGWRQLQATLAAGPAKAVDGLLARPAGLAGFTRDFDAFEASAVGPDSEEIDGLRGWWLRRMLESPQPLEERLTLFWHHFIGASNVRAQNGLLMRKHVQVLRQHALGSYQELLVALSRDSATLLSCDDDEKATSSPNVGFARALLENYTVGPGVATPIDQREAARAFAGRYVMGKHYREVPSQFDRAEKTVLGRSKLQTGEDVIAAALAHPATARNVVRRLYGWFISETAPPTDGLIEPLAESFRRDYQVLPLLRTILRSNLFYSPHAYRQRIKSPIEFALGLILAFDGLVPTTPLGADLLSLGQGLCTPPLLRGWEGGKGWINRFTLLARANLAAALVAADGRYGGNLDPGSLAAAQGARSPEAMAKFLIDLLLQGDLCEHSRQIVKAATTTNAARRAVEAVAVLPEYQLV